MSRDDDDSTAWKDLQEFLDADEVVEAISFGAWASYGTDVTKVTYDEPEPHIPFDKRCMALTPEEAEPLMQHWQFNGGYGGAECYAVTIWTNQRVIRVHEYDGSTCLSGASRNPSTACPTFG